MSINQRDYYTFQYIYTTDQDHRLFYTDPVVLSTWFVDLFALFKGKLIVQFKPLADGGVEKDCIEIHSAGIAKGTVA
jgi:hypothetical protein